MSFMKLPNKFTSDSTAFGCWLKVPSSITAEIAALSGFDYVCIDMQHGFSDRNDLIPMLQAIQPHTHQALVRVPSNESSVISWALDAGATGVIVPLVNSAEEAEKAVKACLYPPKGNRSMGPTRAVRVFGEEYVQGATNSIQCLPMIETLDALDNLDSILSVEGVDAMERVLATSSFNCSTRESMPSNLFSLRKKCKKETSQISPYKSSSKLSKWASSKEVLACS